MNTKAPVSGAIGEVVEASTADSSAEQVDQAQYEENTQEVVADETPDDLSDDDFTAFMERQLGAAFSGETADSGEYDSTDEQANDEATDDYSQDDSEEPILDDDDVDGSDSAGTDEDTTDTNQTYTVEVNGEQITISDPADINRLLKRGLSYAAEAKANLPAQKLAQMLANNELGDEAKVSKLIDVAKGDVNALRALLKEHNIDPYSLSEAVDEEYVPNDHSVSDKSIELNKVLDALQDSEAFSTTANVVMEEWDAASRQEFMDKPQNFSILNAQVEDGTYDAINKEINKLSMLDKLPTGMTQFEVYKTVGDQLYAANMLPGQVAPAASKEVKPNPKSRQPSAEQRLQEAANLQQRKRAVAPSRSIPPTQTNHSVASEQFINSSSDADFIAQTKHLFKNL